MSILVTGGAGFIGANFVLAWLEGADERIVNLDKLTYAGNLQNLSALVNHPGHGFAQGDICDAELVGKLLREHAPRAVIHFAAESHVDRSIRGPQPFIQTNVVGTAVLLEEARRYWAELKGDERDRFRFLHVSTDEVFGSLAPGEPPFTEKSAYAPNSPYAASKAAADHLARAYYHTYGLPVIITNCSNNYGPRQFPEKLIPLVILNAIAGKPLPVYGDGLNVRDWLFVIDHCDAIRAVLERGRPGATYNVGGNCEKTNLEVVRAICACLDTKLGRTRPSSELIQFVTDRPGHDRRYAMDASRIREELGWTPREDFSGGIEKTVEWYLANSAWVRDVVSGEYRHWIHLHYAGA
jgi:dTDP-glucose 4,6-dehydratase